jgi:uncharacterized membrane protein YdbT with pleckstrin-like domain
MHPNYYQAISFYMNKTPCERRQIEQGLGVYSMAGYVESSLTRNERVVFKTKIHWVSFFSIKSLLTLGLLPLVTYNSNEYAITNNRIIIKTGLMSVKTYEMNLKKIETVKVEQSLFGRMLNYGNLTIVGTGGTNEIFFTIARPLEFRKSFHAIVE